MKKVVGILGKSILRGLGIAFCVSGLCFAVAHLIPGDVALEIAMTRYGESDVGIIDRADRVREEEGLSLPLAVQYLDWIGKVARLDFGISLIDKTPTLPVVLRALKFSALLGVVALGFSLCVALPVGIVVGLRPRGKFYLVTAMLSSLIVSIPSFVWGISLIVLFALKLKWLPVAGFLSPTYVILPAATIALTLSATSSRIIAVSLAETINSPYYAFARHKGLSELWTLFFHGLRNASVPVVTCIGMQAASLFGGTIAIETLFNWPGVGLLFLNAVTSRDIPVLQTAGIAMGLICVAVNTTVDLLCLVLKPTARLERLG
ncbi:ABC transporter permease [Synergistales bacterium]|nr:ABC transporter permease [Synergistales bacterium]